MRTTYMFNRYSIYVALAVISVETSTALVTASAAAQNTHEKTSADIRKPANFVRSHFEPQFKII